MHPTASFSDSESRARIFIQSARPRQRGAVGRQGKVEPLVARQFDPEYRPVRFAGSGRQVPAMRFDDGFANRQSQTHAAGFRRKERLEQLLARLRIESRSGICNRDHDGIGLINTRFNTQLSRRMFGSGHGFNCIHDQIQNDLL